ncbi:hypothetical protein N7478_003569 [Penicillium angulare]|uniref:uncharacterized protein n=1 Tax=Penicillium angulare TaxID=116970 RepID=UPI0025416C08|nr:uncharacterized protein N7478_003569 [Penicillium angulare]KAJ5287883.1 hypothetical protein N7478_003569 [Penicillium angulare]
MKEYLKGREGTVNCAPDRDRGYIECGKFLISVPSSLIIALRSRREIKIQRADLQYQLRA